MTTEKTSWPARACLLLVIVLPLFSYPLSWLPSSTTPFRNLTLPLATLTAALVLCWCVGRNLVFTHSLLVPAMCWLASALLAVRFSQQPHVSVGLLPVVAGNACLLFLGASYPRERLRLLMWCWLIAAGVVAINGLVRLPTDVTMLSTIGNQNVTAAYLATAVPLAFALRNRWGYLLAGLASVALIFCHSRSAWLALGVVALIGFVATNRRRLWLLAPAVVLTGWLTASQWQKDVRPVIWEGTIKMATMRPLTGYGLGTFLINYPQFRPPEYFARPKAAPVTDHAHDELLEIAAEQGLIGLGATLWLWGVAVWLGVRGCRENPLLTGLVGAVIVLLVHGLLDIGLRFAPTQPLFWLLLGLMAGGSTQTLRRRIPVILAPVCLAVAGWIFVTGVWLPVRADWLEHQARQANSAGDHAAALTNVEHVLALQPFRIPTRYYYAQLLAQDVSPAGTLRALDTLLKLQDLSPDYADTPYNIGCLYLQLKQPRRAILYLQRAIAINPQNADSQRALQAARMQL